MTQPMYRLYNPSTLEHLFTTGEWEKEIVSSRHSLYPVCQDTTDRVIGVLDIKDYFALTDRSAEKALAECVKPAYFVPEVWKI